MSNLSLTDWVIDKIKKEYADDVALLVAVEGSSINNDRHGVDFDYFVPATERGNNLSQTFIINGIGNDLYPRSWERTEATAEMKDLATQCLGKAKILYAKSKEDEERFEAIRQRLFDNLNDPSFRYRKALENLDTAMSIYSNMMFQDELYRVRCQTGHVFHFLTVAVGCLNGSYQWDYSLGFIGEISLWEKLPDEYLDIYRSILGANTVEQLKGLTHQLITNTRRFIESFAKNENTVNTQPDYMWLAEWYQELKTCFSRIYYYCSNSNADSAFRDACNLQNELGIICSAYSLETLDLLGEFDAYDLKLLADRTLLIEEKIIEVIESNGITIRRYDTLEAFIVAAD